MFEAIAVAEKQHEKRYNTLLANIEAGRVFKREQPVLWRCRNCGYVHEGTEAPDLESGVYARTGSFRASRRELVRRSAPPALPPA